MPTDIQFKDDLRKELMMYRDYLDLLESGDTEKLKKKFEDNIKRINESLQDQCIVRGADYSLQYPRYMLDTYLVVV